MPTTVVKTIRASGGDYTTLTAWEAANQGNLVTSDEIRVAECYDDWATGLDDKLVIDGSTTDDARYLMITVAAGHRHTGVPQSGFYIKKNVGFDTVVRDSDPYTRLAWLDIENTNSNGQALYANAGSGVYGNLIAKTAGTSQYVVGLYGQNITIHGALVYGGGSGVQINSTIAANIYNSVAAGCNNGFNTGSALAVLKNCTAYNNTTNYSGTFSASSTNNATSSASDDAPGAGSVVGITSADFVNAASNDFHLAAGSALIGAGVNLYADLQADVDGDAWPSSGAWDIGFDSYVAGGGGANLTITEALHGHTTDNISLTSSPTLLIVESAHAHGSDSLSLSSSTYLDIGSVLHSHVSDTTTLTIELILSVFKALHSHYSESISLNLAYFLAIANSSHVSSSDIVSLASNHLLAISESFHSHISDTASVSDVPTIDILDAVHSHSIDLVTLSSIYNLNIADSIHSISTDTLSLSSQFFLAISESLHSHSVDNVVTSSIPTLDIFDSLHAHSANSINLTTDYWIQIAEAIHSLDSTNIDLTYDALLEIASSILSHSAKSVGLNVSEFRTRVLRSIYLSQRIQESISISQSIPKGLQV